MGVGGVDGEGEEKEFWPTGLVLGYQNNIKCVYTCKLCPLTWAYIATQLKKIFFKYSWFIILCFYYITKWFSYTYIYIFQILSHYDLSQDIEHRSLWYSVGPCLSILPYIY